MEDLPQYEFSAEENSLVAQLAKKLGCVGFFMLVLGSIYAFSAIVPAIPTGPVNLNTMAIPAIFLVIFGSVALVFLATGGAMRGAARSFNQIADTQGSDISHLMAALTKLVTVYKVWTIMMLLGFVATALAVLWVFAAAAFMGSRF